MTLTFTFDLDSEKFTQGHKFWNISIKENLPKCAWICIGHNLLLADVCSLRAMCLKFFSFSIPFCIVLSSLNNISHSSVFQKGKRFVQFGLPTWKNIQYSIPICMEGSMVKPLFKCESVCIKNFPRGILEVSKIQAHYFARQKFISYKYWG